MPRPFRFHLMLRFGKFASALFKRASDHLWLCLGRSFATLYMFPPLVLIVEMDRTPCLSADQSIPV